MVHDFEVVVDLGLEVVTVDAVEVFLPHFMEVVGFGVHHRKDHVAALGKGNLGVVLRKKERKKKGWENVSWWSRALDPIVTHP